MQHFEEAREIWKRYVPASGQAKTVQGELLRAVEKLRDEAIRNGNLNWDAGFVMLLAYLRERLTDEQVFPAAQVAETNRILDRLSDAGDPFSDDDLYDYLGDQVVEYFRFHGSQPHQRNPVLRR